MTADWAGWAVSEDMKGMKTGLILSVIWIFSVASACPQGITQSTGSDVDDLQINLRIVGIDDSNIIFEIQEGITQGSMEIVYGGDLNGLLNSPVPIAELSGPFSFYHKFEVAWPHPDIDSDPRSAFFRAHHRVGTGSPIPSENFVIESIGARMIWVEPGTFLMGSPESETGRYSEETQHSVTLTKGYWLGQTEVTQAQWATVMGTIPIYFSGSGQFPVEQVSWEDCQKFCRRLTESERQAGRLSDSMRYTLPTEAQWEYACRAGTTGMSWLGDYDILGLYNAPALGQIAWYGGNSAFKFDGGWDSSEWPEKEINHSRAGTQVVAGKPANPWGFHDMLGNVWEWCSDGYGDYPNGAVTDPVGPSLGLLRVRRGGSWYDVAVYCRSAARGRITQTGRHGYIGFRLSLQTGD